MSGFGIPTAYDNTFECLESYTNNDGRVAELIGKESKHKL
jgi:hypothetical protein